MPSSTYRPACRLTGPLWHFDERHGRSVRAWRCVNGIETFTLFSTADDQSVLESVRNPEVWEWRGETSQCYSVATSHRYTSCTFLSDELQFDITSVLFYCNVHKDVQMFYLLYKCSLVRCYFAEFALITAGNHNLSISSIVFFSPPYWSNFLFCSMFWKL